MLRLKQGAKATEILKTLNQLFTEKSYICEEQTNNEYEAFKRHSMFCHCCMLVAISCTFQYIHMRVRNIPSSASVAFVS